MTRLFGYCILLISLAGCGHNPFKQEVSYVEIPTPTSCVTWEPSREVSEFEKTTGDGSLWEQVKALLVDRANDQRFIEGQASVISGCK